MEKPKPSWIERNVKKISGALAAGALAFGAYKGSEVRQAEIQEATKKDKEKSQKRIEEIKKGIAYLGEIDRAVEQAATQAEASAEQAGEDDLLPPTDEEWERGAAEHQRQLKLDDQVKEFLKNNLAGHLQVTNTFDGYEIYDDNSSKGLLKISHDSKGNFKVSGYGSANTVKETELQMGLRGYEIVGGKVEEQIPIMEDGSLDLEIVNQRIKEAEELQANLDKVRDSVYRHNDEVDKKRYEEYEKNAEAESEEDMAVEEEQTAEELEKVEKDVGSDEEVHRSEQNN